MGSESVGLASIFGTSSQATLVSPVLRAKLSVRMEGERGEGVPLECSVGQTLTSWREVKPLLG